MGYIYYCGDYKYRKIFHKCILYTYKKSRPLKGRLNMMVTDGLEH